MPPLRLYIETSVWSYYFADDAPQAQDLTRTFFQRCQLNSAQVLLHVSDVVLQEIRATPPPKVNLLTELVSRFRPTILDIPDEVRELSAAYVDNHAIPPSREADAMHAAIATVHEMDALVSWNYRHMVSLPRRRMIVAVNTLVGYNRPIEIITPPEVFEDAS
jgi:predicted nucleic acid-binding protein